MKIRHLVISRSNFTTYNVEKSKNPLEKKYFIYYRLSLSAHLFYQLILSIHQKHPSHSFDLNTI